MKIQDNLNPSFISFHQHKIKSSSYDEAEDIRDKETGKKFI